MARKPQTSKWGQGSTYWDESKGQYVAERQVDGRRIRGTGRDKTAARASLEKLLQERQMGTLGRDRRVTVESAVRRFLDLAVPNRAGGTLAPSTRIAHRWAGDLIIAGLGSRRLASLSVVNVEDFLHSLTVSQTSTGQSGKGTGRRILKHGAPLSRSSLVKVRSTLSLVLEDARRRGEVTSNVAKIAHLPADAPRQVERRSLTPDEARRLLTFLRDFPNGAMYALMLRTGLRPGEAAGLHWSSLTGSDLTVSRAVQVARGTARVVDNLKTAASRRTIELPDDLVALLAQHRRQQAVERLAASEWADPSLMFATSRGGVVDPSSSRRSLNRACQLAGVPLVTPNELRHSCASLLSDEGVRNEDIADLLGHTTTRMVERTYRHRLRQSVDVAKRATWATGT